MTDIAPIPAERLFTHFIDEVDGTLCLPARATVADIRAQAATHQLRFPLVLDCDATLLEQVAAATHSPASCRFGPYCDNILGMNWRLPGGRIARIGERVVKTTTGYDWLRFLLHTGARFGEPIDYVVRLRPDCGFTAVAGFHGGIHTLRACVTRLLHGGWMHWWDAVDFIAGNGMSSVRAQIHCTPGEEHLFARRLTEIADATDARLTLRGNEPPPVDGLPDLVIKTTPDRVISLAGGLASDTVRCVALCYNGVVHVYLRDGGDVAGRAHALMQPHVAELHSLGGDWHSRHLPPPPPAPAESRWIETLEAAVHAP
jgi:FAD/FMN-containing dehydrogenase